LQNKNELEIAVLVGSFRKESYNRKTAKAVMALAPKNLELQIIEIGDLPLYREDLDTETPRKSISAMPLNYSIRAASSKTSKLRLSCENSLMPNRFGPLRFAVQKREQSEDAFRLG
jgi:hypothetical protein